jgi:hypothetical protein
MRNAASARAVRARVRRVELMGRAPGRELFKRCQRAARFTTDDLNRSCIGKVPTEYPTERQPRCSRHECDDLSELHVDCISTMR